MGSIPLRVLCFSPEKSPCSQCRDLCKLSWSCCHLLILVLVNVCIALGDYPQNHTIAEIVIMNLIIVSDMELIIEYYPFDIGGGLKQHLS
jgi:hypothetical protein